MFALASFAKAGDIADPKAVWGGGKPESSAYSGVYVPAVIDALAKANPPLPGYHWGGVSDGTVANAEIISEHPTNLAVGQLDILSALQGQPIPGKNGEKYQFTILSSNLGPECLYIVTKDPNYKTLGDIVGNAWDLKGFTGGLKSGSNGTWNELKKLFPDLATVEMNNVADNLDLIHQVANTPGSFGFFVMRPDANSKVFETIAEQKLTIVPVVDEALQGYNIFDMKVAHAAWYTFSGGKSVMTSCTSVALITGDPTNAALATDEKSKKRLAATIMRVKSLDPQLFQPDTSDWRDMVEGLQTVAADQAKEGLNKRIQEGAHFCPFFLYTQKK